MTNPLHILAMEGWPTLLAGGQERSLFEVVTGLRQAGVEVTLAYEEEGDLVPRYQALGVATFQIPVRNLQLKSRRVITNTLRFATAVARILRQQRRQARPVNLIYVNQYFDTPLAALCGRLLGVPVVCHLRLPAPEYLSRQYRWGLNRCAKLIANSQFTAETYVQAGLPRERIVVIHNAIDTDIFTPPSPEQREALATRDYRQVLYVGRITPEKGIDTLIEAMALARQQDPRLRLLVVGNVRGAHTATAGYHEALQARGRELLGDGVEFRPATPDVISLYHQADLVVLPSRWEEPFGRVLIEAMACGVPCIGARIGGIPEVLNGAFEKFLFRADDKDDLAGIILELSDWGTTCAQLSSMTREHVINQFSHSRMRETMMKELAKAATLACS